MGSSLQLRWHKAQWKPQGVEGFSPDQGPQSGPYLAFERLFPGVLERVDLEGHAALEGLPTGLTGEGHVLGVCWGDRGRSGASTRLHHPPPHTPAVAPSAQPQHTQGIYGSEVSSISFPNPHSFGSFGGSKAQGSNHCCQVQFAFQSPALVWTGPFILVTLQTFL